MLNQFNKKYSSCSVRNSRRTSHSKKPKKLVAHKSSSIVKHNKNKRPLENHNSTQFSKRPTRRSPNFTKQPKVVLRSPYRQIQSTLMIHKQNDEILTRGKVYYLWIIKFIVETSNLLEIEYFRFSVNLKNLISNF